MSRANSLRLAGSVNCFCFLLALNFFSTSLPPPLSTLSSLYLYYCWLFIGRMCVWVCVCALLTSANFAHLLFYKRIYREKGRGRLLIRALHTTLTYLYFLWLSVDLGSSVLQKGVGPHLNEPAKLLVYVLQLYHRIVLFSYFNNLTKRRRRGLANLKGLTLRLCEKLYRIFTIKTALFIARLNWNLVDRYR